MKVGVGVEKVNGLDITRVSPQSLLGFRAYSLKVVFHNVQFG
jgi:hypothetical protein